MPVPAEATERRVALLVATADYGDPALVRLRSPGQDASDLAGVLRDPQIGGFEVTMVVNASSGQLQEEIEGFCAWVLLAALLVNLAAPVLRISRIGRPAARAGS